MVDKEKLPPSVVKKIEEQEKKDVETGRETRVVVPDKPSGGGGGFRFRGKSISQRISEQTPKVPGTEITQAEIKKRVEARQAAEEARRERILVKTPEQKALALAAAQQRVKASPQFEALRASRLAEEKKKIQAPKEETVILGGGRVQVTGEVSPFLPQKEPADTALGGTAKRLLEAGFDVDIKAGTIIAKKKDQRVFEIKPTLTEVSTKIKQEPFLLMSQEPFSVKSTEFRVGLQEKTIAKVPATARVEPDLARRPPRKEIVKGIDFATIQRFEAIGKESPLLPTARASVELGKKTRQAAKEFFQEQPVRQEVTFSQALDVTVPKIVPSFLPRSKRFVQFRESQIAVLEKRKGESKVGDFFIEQQQAALRVEAGGTRFVSETLEAIRVKPSKAVTSFLAGVTLPVGLGQVAAVSPSLGSFLVKGLKVGGRGLLITFGGVTAVQTALAEPEQRISILAERTADVIPFVAGGIVGSKILQSDLRALRPKKIVTFKAQKGKITGKELKKIKAIAEVEQPTQQRLEIDQTVEEGIRIDINKLSEKQLLQIIKLQKGGKLTSNFEISLTKAPTGEVGLSFKPRRGVADFELKARQRVSEKFIKGFLKNAGKSRSQFEKTSQARIQSELSLEGEVRSRLAKDSTKTAADIVKEIKAEREITQEVTKIKPGPKGKGRVVPPSGKPFEDFGKAIIKQPSRFGEGIDRVLGSGRRGKKLLLIEEEQIVRGFQELPDQIEIQLPGTRQITLAQQLSQIAQEAGKVPLALSSFRNENITRVQQAQRQLNLQVSTTQQALRQQVIQDLSSFQTQIQVQQVQQGQAQRQTAIQIPIVRQISTQEQEQVITGISTQRLKLQQIQKVEQIKEEVTVIKPELDLVERVKEKRLPGYIGQVKQKGKFIDINRDPLTRNSALNLALKAADESPSVVARVKRKGFTKQRFDQNINPFLINKFEVRKDIEKKGNVFVEKNRFRIDSPGEIAGIPIKGQQARRVPRFF